MWQSQNQGQGLILWKKCAMLNDLNLKENKGLVDIPKMKGNEVFVWDSESFILLCCRDLRVRKNLSTLGPIRLGLNEAQFSFSSLQTQQIYFNNSRAKL